MKMNPTYLLDENIQPTRMEINSPDFIPLRRITHKGTPDWLLLEIVKEKNLIAITNDKGLILRALSESQDIIYEDQKGNRFFFYGRDNFLFSEAEPIKIDWAYRAKIRKSEKLSKMRVSHISLDGFSSITCI